MLQFIPDRTPWHITFGTYGSRIHGDARVTVDKSHNQRGDDFLEKKQAREASARGRMKFPPRYLTKAQRIFIESALPNIAVRGGWILRTCSAAPDHVHVVLDIEKKVHGEKVRRLIKRWLGQELCKCWPLPEGATWWAEEGSNKAIDTLEYLNNAFGYVRRQRVTPDCSPADGAEDGPARLASAP